MYGCALSMYLISLEVKSVCKIPWNWNYGWPQDTMYVLRNEPGSSTRTEKLKTAKLSLQLLYQVLSVWSSLF